MSKVQKENSNDQSSKEKNRQSLSNGSNIIWFNLPNEITHDDQIPIKIQENIKQVSEN